MIYGHNTLASVALRIIQDYAYYGMDNHHTVRQAIERVCMREESLAGGDETPSYLWWYFSADEGELRVIVDRGKLAEVRRRGTERQYRYVAAKEISEEDLHGICRDHAEAALRMGVGIGQRILSRVIERWSKDYWGESDSDLEREILFADASGPYPIAMETGLPVRGKARRITFA